jgi:uncharacterized protein (TIGR02265 family)
MAIPNPNSALTTAALLAQVPVNARTKGMFFNFATDACRTLSGRAVEAKRYTPFKDYPSSEFLRVAERCARDAMPDLPASEAFYRMGFGIYEAFANTLVGTTLFAMTGHRFARVIEMADKAYRISQEPGSAKVVVHGPGHATAHIRDQWHLVDSFQVGIWEGAMSRCNVTGNVTVKLLSPCDADFDMVWKEL